MNFRKRDKLKNENFYTSNKLLDDSDSLTKSDDQFQSNSNRKKDKLTILYWAFLFGFGILLFDLAIRLQLSCEYENGFPFYNKCDKANEKDQVSDVTFNDSLARTHLQAISKLGNRPCGSTANEIHTPMYIINYLEALKSRYTSDQKQSNIKLTISEQVAQLNSFPIVILGKHITSIYDKIKNIIVRLHDTSNDETTTSAVLINCHYDSFFGGIGASDDLASCAVMLETIHSILKSQPISLRFDLLFLFNGAEENMLQGSHAFVSQHRFARDVKIFVNLEAAGSGGRQMVFQTSQNNPWLIRELASVFRQPLATVIGQEIFSANLIPSDTDFRIFRDFGHVPGIDIAFITNGYVYHTSYDTEDRIPQSCLRHTGRNLISLALKLANSDNVAIYSQDEKFVQQSSSNLNWQRIVYFDFLGFVLISYSEFSGILVNFGLILASIILILWRSRFYGDHYFGNVFRALLSQLGWVLSNFLFGAALGFLVDKFGSKMSWYAIRYNVIGLYLIPLSWYFFTYHQFISRLFLSSSNELNAVYYRDSSLIILTIITCCFSIFFLLSSYLIGLWLFFAVINILMDQILQWFQKSLNFSANCVHFLRDTFCLSIPFIYSFYLLYMLYDVFIPILGRSGPIYPDIIISGLTALSVIIPCLVLSASFYLTSKSSKKWLTFILLHLSISYYIFLHCTQYGFPYNQSELMPRKQRIIINHVTRNIRNDMGHTHTSESGIWMISLDSNKLKPLKTQLQDVIREPMQEVFCELRPYCGYPMLYSFAQLIDNSLWITQRAHQLQPTASLVILSKVTHISGMVNVTMQMTGPSHTHIYIMTPKSMRLLSWSLGPDPPQPIQMPSFSNPNYLHYFIYYAYGQKPDRPLKLWFIFMPKISPQRDVSDGVLSDHQIEIALGAHYLTAQTSELETMLHLMPRWVVPTTIASTYEHLIVDFDQNLSYVQ